MEKEGLRINFKGRIEIAKKVIRAELPPALSAQCHPLALIGVVLLAISLGLLLISSFRGAAPFGLMLSLLMLGTAYIRKREMVLKGYRERMFRTLDYTFTVPMQKKPTGILLIEPETNNIYHVAVTNRASVPPLDWDLKVYIPVDATATEFNGRFYFNRVFGYSIETGQNAA